jgi:tetratricopeptide (TPR) repeat protein
MPICRLAPCYDTNVPEVPIPASLTRKQAIRLASITPQQLVAWEKLGLFSPQETYSQRDLVVLRNLRTLRAAGVPYARLTNFLETLRQRTGTNADPLHDLRLRRHGRKLAVHWQGRQMEAESGQLLLELEPADLKAILSFPARVEKQQEDQRKKQASEIFYRALERENQGAPAEEVAPLYQEALRLDAQCFGAHLNLGTIYFNQKRMRLAEQHYKRAIEIHPTYVLAHFNLASLYDEQGRLEKALECYHKALELDGKYVDAHYNLALLYQNLGRTMEATRHWKTFLKLDPSSEWANIARRELKRLIESAVLPGTGAKRACGAESNPSAEAAGGGAFSR